MIQLPPEFNLDHIQTLSDFTAALPKEYRYVVEVRNKELVNDELYSLLRKNGIALAFVDHPFLPRIDAATADFVYVRLEGDRGNVKGTLGKVERDRTNEIEQWADTTKSLLSLNQEVFIYISKYYSGHPQLMLSIYCAFSQGIEQFLGVHELAEQLSHQICSLRLSILHVRCRSLQSQCLTFKRISSLCLLGCFIGRH